MFFIEAVCTGAGRICLPQLECRRSQAACPGCGKTFTQGDAGG